MIVERRKTLLGSLLGMVVTGMGAAALTVVFFLVLPLIQAITDTERPDTVLSTMDTGEVPPPPPAPEDEPEPEPEEEEKPPELTEQNQPLSLSQLDIALDGGLGGGVGSLGVNVSLNKGKLGGGGLDEMFSFADLDQKPRVTNQVPPVLSAALRKKTPAQVYVLFIVDKRGRVKSPRIQKTTNPAFNAAALKAVKKWRFDPGKKGGKPVEFRMRVPITFPKG